MSNLDKLKEILDDRDDRLRDMVPDIANSEDPKIASYRLKLGIRKPSQKILLSQIFGEPDSPEETAMQQFFRIKREQV